MELVTPSLPTSTLEIEEILALAEYDFEQGQLESALKKLKQILAAQPENLIALALSAKLYARLRLYEQAKNQYQRYLEIEPTSLEMQFELGMIHRDLGQSDVALAHWDSVLTQVPTFPPGLFYAALLLNEQQRVHEAQRHINVLLQTAAKDNLYYARAQELLESMNDTNRDAERAI